MDHTYNTRQAKNKINITVANKQQAKCLLYLACTLYNFLPS